MKLNKKGASYMGLMTSIAIFLAIVSITSGFIVYVTRHKQNVVEQNQISQDIGAHISQVYNADWENLEDETIIARYGEIEVSYELLGETEFSTNQLGVTFEKDGESNTYQLERSVYHE